MSDPSIKITLHALQALALESTSQVEWEQAATSFFRIAFDEGIDFWEVQGEIPPMDSRE